MNTLTMMNEQRDVLDRTALASTEIAGMVPAGAGRSGVVTLFG